MSEETNLPASGPCVFWALWWGIRRTSRGWDRKGGQEGRQRQLGIWSRAFARLKNQSFLFEQHNKNVWVRATHSTVILLSQRCANSSGDTHYFAALNFALTWNRTPCWPFTYAFIKHPSTSPEYSQSRQGKPELQHRLWIRELPKKKEMWWVRGEEENRTCFSDLKPYSPVRRNDWSESLCVSGGWGVTSPQLASFTYFPFYRQLWHFTERVFLSLTRKVNGFNGLFKPESIY